MLEKIRRWLALHPNWTLTFITFAALMPFLAKPFDLDDPMYLWAGHQIQAHPTNPYGLDVAWDTTVLPMWKVMENPPLDSYYIALAASILGWSEIALHLAFVLPAIAVILGTHRLARALGANPMLAALATLFTPVFLVSATTVMCDVPMLACWVWAVVFWVEGQECTRKLWLAGGLIALAEMTKYTGTNLMPLLAAYSLVSRRPIKQWAPFLLIPLAVLCAYQYVTQSAYGYSLLYRAMDYAAFSKSLIGFSKIQNSLIALAFAGGGMAAVIFLLSSGGRKCGMLLLGAVAGLLGIILFFDGLLWNRYDLLHGAALTFVKIQMIFWATGGPMLLVLAVVEACRRRDANSLLLLLWIMGVFYFSACCNWTVNARSILPMTPAAAILVARWLQPKLTNQKSAWPTGVIISLIAGGVLTMAVARADFFSACAVRQCAQEICARHGSGPGTLWFQGHWGFQYYMAESGGTALDFNRSILKPGDRLVIPAGNTSIMWPHEGQADPLDVVVFSGARWLSTWHQNVGAGFYASGYGPLPFAFGAIPPAVASVYIWKAPPAPWFRNPK